MWVEADFDHNLTRDLELAQIVREVVTSKTDANISCQKLVLTRPHQLRGGLYVVYEEAPCFFGSEYYFDILVYLFYYTTLF